MSTSISTPIIPTLEGWRKVNYGPSPEGLEVRTCICDEENGLRNDQSLVRKGNLWFHPDMTMYVYYTPTHWRYLT